MRQILNDSCCQIWRIADNSIFNGYHADESGFFSDFSLYEDDLSEDEILKGEDVTADRIQAADGSSVVKGAKNAFAITNFYVRREQLKKALSQAVDSIEGPVRSNNIHIEMRKDGDSTNIFGPSDSSPKGLHKDARLHTDKSFNKDDGSTVTKVKKRKHISSGDIAIVGNLDKHAMRPADSPTLNILSDDHDSMMHKKKLKSKDKSLHPKSNHASNLDHLHVNMEENGSRKVGALKKLHAVELHSDLKKQIGVDQASPVEGFRQVSSTADVKPLKFKEQKSERGNKLRDEDKDIMLDNKVIRNDKMVEDEAFRTVSVKVDNTSKTMSERDAVALKEYEQQSQKGSLKTKRKLVKGLYAGSKDQGEWKITNANEGGKVPNIIQKKRPKEELVGSHTDSRQWKIGASYQVDKNAKDKAAATDLSMASKKQRTFLHDDKGQKGSESLFDEKEMACENDVYRSSAVRTERGPSNVSISNDNVAKAKSLMSELARSVTGVAKQEKLLDTTLSFSSAGANISQRAHAKDYDCKALIGDGSSVTEGVTGYKGDSAEHEIMNVGWVSCDDCHKWRRIPATLADVIEATNCQWRCRDNPNKDYADCSIPQEKSNAEINAELNISEASFCKEEDDEPLADSGHRQRAVWTRIRRNVFLHRQRKIQSIDEVMVCQCKLPKDGRMGCGSECLNRIISIECVSEACPCGEFCSNQQFQRRAYTKLRWYRYGKKGYGLQVLEDVRRGIFIIEYVGEVLDRSTYLLRQKEYARRGQKHFYFMKLNVDEVVDAYAKGNLGRFINHSCEPNCTTEKWMVNGEICIGVFAARNLVKGEEITIDYNRAQVCGAAAKKCHCRSSVCRGFFGGDSTAPLAIAESDSDEEDPEPLMIEEQDKQEDTVFESRRLLEGNRHAEESSSPTVSALKRRLASIEVPENVTKRIKLSSLEDTGSGKELFIETSRAKFGGVQERLKALLDENGGLSKRKDSAVLYLKLLLMTAASGDTVDGEASKRIKDLSMVLDAIFKTGHRSVLVDIINKNGLHIFHNMLKQNKKNYKKTPIIRKVLKVLDFMAARNILTFENMNSSAPYNGIDSIRDTITELSHHNDIEVQLLARRFRDKWLPRKFSKGHRGPVPEILAKNSEKISEDEHRLGPHPQMVPDQEKRLQDYDVAQEQTASHIDAANVNTRTQWNQTGKGGNEKQPSGMTVSEKQIDYLVQSSKVSDHTTHLAHFNRVQGTGNENAYDNQHKGSAGISVSTSVLLPTVIPPATQQASTTDSNLQPCLSTSQKPAVVSGVPVDQTTAVPQQQGVFYGIPVTIGKQGSGSQSVAPNITAGSWESSRVIEPLQSETSRKATEQQHQRLSIEVGPLGPNKESKRITFGIPYNQFFQQMQSIFGPAFNPWHAQLLMAAHSWGPFFSLNTQLSFENAEPKLDPEPPVPGLSPPHNSVSARQGTIGNFQRTDVDIQTPDAPACNLLKPDIAAIPVEISKFRSSRWESSAGQPTEASSGQSSRWESDGLAGQRTESSNWKPESFHEPQDGSTEALNRRFSKWEGSNGPSRKVGHKYAKPIYRQESVQRNYSRPRQLWQTDSSRYHAPNSGAYWDNVSHEDHSERSLPHSHETKWDSMPYTGNSSSGFSPYCLNPPLRSDIRGPQADNRIPDSQSFSVNKLSSLDHETDQSACKKN